MHVGTLRFDAQRGWSASFPAIDSERTLIIVFGAPEYTVSCVGRRLVLGERAEEEEAAAQVLGDAKLVGFYSYGEISPLASGRCELHNQTMTLTRVWEA